jgi:tetratricopeptide (TPR) repeat protein/DNA-binding CsgD family transcriptional regulator
MTRKIYTYIILAATVLLASCSKQNGTDMALEKAESLLSSRPDSALAVIGSLPINEIVSARQKASFILLYERILDKNGISLIGEDDMEDAVAYFDKFGSDKDKFLSHFYLGRLYDAADNDYQAMEQYVQAEGIMMKQKKDLSGQDVNLFGCDDIMASLYVYKGDIYRGKLNSNGALKMYLKAAECYSGLGDKVALMQTMGKVAGGYEGVGKYDKAVEAYGHALNLARQCGSGSDILQYATSMAGAGFSTGVPSSVVLKQLDSIYAIYNNGVAPQGNYIMLSCLYLDNGDVRRAALYASLYEETFENLSPMEMAGLASLKASIAKADGNYRDALGYKEVYDGVMEQINEQERANSVQEIEQLYYNKQLMLENENIKRQNRSAIIIYSLITVILLLGLVWAAVSWRRKIRQKNGQIEEYLAVANEAELSRNNLLGELDVQKEKEKRLKELLENRFAEIRELAGTYYEFGYSKKLQKKVEELLSLQSFGKDMFEVIENVVNAKNNGAMEKIRANYPSITEENFKLLNLIYAGFSPQEISVILNDTPQNIYVRKSRLKRKISALLEQEPEMSFK